MSSLRGIVFLFLALLLAGTPDMGNAASRGFSSSKYAALTVHGKSGVILFQENADKKRYPASLTKLMTAYMVFEKLRERKLSMNSMLTVSSRAASQPRIRLGLRKNERIKVKEALDALVIRSANDVAVVLAEAIAGSEWQFAQMMSEKARELGMKNTRFENASGLFHPSQRTTAKDMVKLLIALERDFPQYYSVLGKTSFSFKGRKYKTHNRILAHYKGARAGKTGYVNASGYNLITSAKRKNDQIIGVVMGGNTSRYRDKKMVTLLDKGFAKLASNPSMARSLGNNIPKPVTRPWKSYDTAMQNKKTILSNLFSQNPEAAQANANWIVAETSSKPSALSAVAKSLQLAGTQLSSTVKRFFTNDHEVIRQNWVTFSNLTEEQALKTCAILKLSNSICDDAMLTASIY